MVLTDKAKTPRALRISRLDRVGAVITELGKLYREARRGEIEVHQATRLASILTALRSALEAGEFERRLDTLEAGVAAGERPSAGLKVIK